MKVAFTADEPQGLESVVSYHFGHCPYFVVVELDGKTVKTVKNIENTYAAGHEAGELPGFMNTLGVDIIATGGMGPKAQEFFANFGIKPFVGAYGKVKDVLSEILEGEVEFSKQTVHQHTEQVEGENEEISRLKKEVQELRKEIAEIKSLLKRKD